MKGAARQKRRTGSREARNRTQPAGLFPLRVLYSPPSRRRHRVGCACKTCRHKKPTGLSEVGTAVWGVSRLRAARLLLKFRRVKVMHDQNQAPPINGRNRQILSNSVPDHRIQSSGVRLYFGRQRMGHPIADPLRRPQRSQRVEHVVRLGLARRNGLQQSRNRPLAERSGKQRASGGNASRRALAGDDTLPRATGQRRERHLRMHLAHHTARLRVTAQQLVPLADLGQDGKGLSPKPTTVDRAVAP